MESNVVYVLNYIIIIAWGISVAYSLIKLRRMGMNPTAQAIWAAVIVFLPFIGAIAFLFAAGEH